MRLVFSKLPLPGKQTVGQEAVSGTASIHAGYSRPTNELGWWDEGGQVLANCRGDSAASHLFHLEIDDVGHGEPAYTLDVPRHLAVPPRNHVKRVDGGGVDLVHDIEDVLTLAAARSLAAVHSRPCGKGLVQIQTTALFTTLRARHADH